MGIFVNELTKIKVHGLVSPVDSVARPKIQCIHQYNCEYGCPYCLLEGRKI